MPMHDDIASSSPKDEGVAQPLMKHMLELRTCLLWVFGVMALGTLVSFFFVDQIYGFLVQPLADAMDDSDTNRLIYTGMAEAFFTYLKVAFFSGVFITFPVLLLRGRLPPVRQTHQPCPCRSHEANLQTRGSECHLESNP